VQISPRRLRVLGQAVGRCRDLQISSQPNDISQGIFCCFGQHKRRSTIIVASNSPPWHVEIKAVKTARRHNICATGPYFGAPFQEHAVLNRLCVLSAAALVASFAILIWTGTRIHQKMPPIPEQVAASNGRFGSPRRHARRAERVTVARRHGIRSTRGSRLVRGAGLDG
jgi:hypothetical protein